MPPERVRIHYHRPGRGTTVFDERLVLDRPDVKVTLLEGYEGRPSTVGERLVLDAGAPVLWFVFPGWCRDVGRFHLADGRFTGWYTNIRAPIMMTGPDWSCTDLFLDHWLPVTGAAAWLDERELAEARAAGLIDDGHAAIVERERREVDALLAAGAWPPVIARDFTLADARRHLNR